MKYIHKGINEIVTVLFRDEKTVYVEYELGKSRVDHAADYFELNYTEYKEPRKAEAWVNVYEFNGGLWFSLPYESDSDAKRNHKMTPNCIDAIRIEYTEKPKGEST